MSRAASFALGASAAAVGYLFLRERLWSRPAAVASGLRDAQAQLHTGGERTIATVRALVSIAAPTTCRHSYAPWRSLFPSLCAQVSAPPLDVPQDIRLLLRSGVATAVALWNGGVAMAHGVASSALRRSERREEGETPSKQP